MSEPEQIKSETRRIKFECWHCERVYSLQKVLNVGEQPKLIVTCPFCEYEAVVDLAPYRSEVVEIFQSSAQENANVGTALNLPDVLPTSPRAE